nr:hypothetical protein [Tanacetum cinerariifolium]
MTELTSNANMVKAQDKSNLSITGKDLNIELSKEFLVKLQKNAYHETYNEDVVEYIAKESKYENPSNTATDSFFEAHDVRDIKEKNELRQMKRKDNNNNDNRPHKKIWKIEKFKATKYSLGPNEEYIAVR